MRNKEIAGVGPSVTLILVNITAMAADLLRFAFAGQQAIQLVGCATTPSELDTLLNEYSPDVALVGSSGSRQESVALPFLEQMAAAGTRVRPIVMSEDMGREDVVSFFRNGARGLVCKSHTDVSVLLKCIRCVGAGQVWANFGPTGATASLLIAPAIVEGHQYDGGLAVEPTRGASASPAGGRPKQPGPRQDA